MLKNEKTVTFQAYWISPILISIWLKSFAFNSSVFGVFAGLVATEKRKREAYLIVRLNRTGKCIMDNIYMFGS